MCSKIEHPFFRNAPTRGSDSPLSHQRFVSFSDIVHKKFMLTHKKSSPDHQLITLTIGGYFSVIFVSNILGTSLSSG